MVELLVRHKVKDFDAWKTHFEAHAAARKSAGCHGARVLRNTADPNEVVVLAQWSDADSARRFGESPDLRRAMETAGVCDRPDTYLLEEAGRYPA